MKIILEKQNTETIHIDDINENYIVVGVISKKPVIAYCNKIRNFKTLEFLIVSDSIIGNSFDFNGGGVNISDAIKYQIKTTKDSKFEAFHQDNWKDALKWLIDNA